MLGKTVKGYNYSIVSIMAAVVLASTVITTDIVVLLQLLNYFVNLNFGYRFWESKN